MQSLSRLVLDSSPFKLFSLPSSSLESLSKAQQVMQAKGAINRKKVNVTVLGAKGLIAADFNGKSDPVHF